MTEETFHQLKDRVTSAPVLTLPDPKHQFVIEVDASDIGIRAVRFQRSQADGQLRPPALLSKKLIPAERNYDIGNREVMILAQSHKVKTEQSRLPWRNGMAWLEGAEQPFLVWTDHRNLEYLQFAKRVNSRQARWAIFFNCFNFPLSYRPDSKNMKPDALSRMFSSEPTSEKPDYILPQTCVLETVKWELERHVLLA